jgi:hypothetical protein
MRQNRHSFLIELAMLVACIIVAAILRYHFGLRHELLMAVMVGPLSLLVLWHYGFFS